MSTTIVASSESSSAAVGSATFNELFVKADRFEWGRLLWEDRTGRVFFVTAWGTWSYRWTHIGEESLAEFLPKLTMQYAGEKFLGNHAYQRSEADTAEAIRETILRDRHEGSLSKEEAREEWGTYLEYKSADIVFEEWMQRTSFADAYEYSRRELDHSWQAVWEKLWEPLVVPALKAHANQTAEVSSP